MNLDISKLIEVAQEVVDDEHGRLQMAESCKSYVQDIEIDGHNYKLSVLLEWIPMEVKG